MPYYPQKDFEFFTNSIENINLDNLWGCKFMFKKVHLF